MAASSDNLAAAYGIAVTRAFVCTSILAVVVFRRQFGWAWSLAIGVFGPLLVIDLLFFVSNVLKIPQGGYVPLILGAGLFAMMTSQADFPLGALLHSLKHNKVLHERVLFVTVTNEGIPTVAELGVRVAI